MIACQIKEKSVEMAELLLSERASADYSAPNKVTYIGVNLSLIYTHSIFYMSIDFPHLYKC